MLEHSNTLETQDIVSLAAAFLSHEKKSSEEVLRVLSAMKGRAESHSELINSLLSMSEHGFSLGSFSHVLDELFSQSEQITHCLNLLATSFDSEGSH
jgi:hypothetical protein